MTFNVEPAVRLNRHHMGAQGERWQPYFDDIARLLGFDDRSPSEWELAEGVARWQRSQRPSLTPDGVIGPKTWTKMRQLLDVDRSVGLLAGKTVTTSTTESTALSTSYGPQSFAPAVPGTTPIDRWLVVRNVDVEQRLFRAADEYYANGDFRWFFSYAHAAITEQINQNIGRFQRPNALLRLNMHFADEFLRAVGGQPHEGWKRAFQSCQALRNGADNTSLLVGEVEFCGAAMASVHIRVDLSVALNEVGCIPPDDYANMLIFVNRGALVALTRLRGTALGAAEAILQQFVAPMVDLEVRTWRDTVYQDACNAIVPDPATGFLAPK